MLIDLHQKTSHTIRNQSRHNQSYIRTYFNSVELYNIRQTKMCKLSRKSKETRKKPSFMVVVAKTKPILEFIGRLCNNSEGCLTYKCNILILSSKCISGEKFAVMRVDEIKFNATII